MQKAIKQASATDTEATAAELAQHKYRLGRVLWTLGGRLRTERGGAHASFLAAAGAKELMPCTVVTDATTSAKRPHTSLPGGTSAAWERSKW